MTTEALQVGDPTNWMYRDTFGHITSVDIYEAQIRFASFTKTDFTKAIGVEAFGVPAMTAPEQFAAARPTGRIIQYHEGVTALAWPIFSETGSSYHTGRFDQNNPEYIGEGDEAAVAWHKLEATRFIPTSDLEDNGKGKIKLRNLRQMEMKNQFVEDFNYAILGNSSAPDSGTKGPSSIYSDLPNLISVTNDRTVCGIDKTSTAKWQTGATAITSIGGGGEMDRPMILRRKMEAGIVARQQYKESTLDYLFACTPGAWLYYGRLMYADSIQSGSFAVKKSYDAAGINHYTFMKQPFVFDNAITIPYGASASTEAIYGIHVPSYFLSIRRERNFKFIGWEKSRLHDGKEAEIAKITLRYTPGMKQMRPNTVFYNIPDNGDI